MILTYRYRIKDSSARRHLARHARAVNFVWNFCCETQRTAQRWGRKWPTAFDLINLTAGCSADLGIAAETVNEVCRQFAAARAEARRCPRFRSSNKSLGWIPVRASTIQLGAGFVRYRKRPYYYWDSRAVGGPVKTGSFGQDARGRWYINLQCQVDEAPLREGAAVGVDLGLKELAVLSDGSRIENPRIFRRYEAALSVALRGGNKQRVRAIHAKIANSRRHFLHEQSTLLVRQYGKIVVGDVNAGQLKRARIGKSVSDAGWSMFRSQLRYKAIRHGVVFVEANERWSSQTCSACSARSGPQGRKGLGVRQWICSSCGAVHDRDINAAANILAGAECRPPFGESLAA